MSDAWKTPAVLAFCAAAALNAFGAISLYDEIPAGLTVFFMTFALYWTLIAWRIGR